MENIKSFGSNPNRLKELLANDEFVNFLCYKEDKWLQNSDIESKLNVIFGSVESAVYEFNRDVIFNSKNF